MFLYNKQLSYTNTTFGDKMKKLLLIITLVCNLFALDLVSSIPDDQKKVISRVIEALQLPSDEGTKEIVYGKLGDFFTKNWSAHWTTNSTAANTKIAKSQTQICDVTIYNDNRIANCTFVYFKKEKQLFITLKQYVEAESDLILDMYKKRKEDSQYTLENETDNYAYFQQKGYMSYEAHHVKSPVGMVIYESSYVFDIK